MVPPPSVVVVVVLVVLVCPQANGATNASAMLSNVFFIVPFRFEFPLSLMRSPGDSSSLEKAAFAFYLIRRRENAWSPLVAGKSLRYFSATAADGSCHCQERMLRLSVRHKPSNSPLCAVSRNINWVSGKLI